MKEMKVDVIIRNEMTKKIMLGASNIYSFLKHKDAENIK
jgi:hypothetical protein